MNEPASLEIEIIKKHTLFMKSADISEPLYDLHPERSKTDNQRYRKTLLVRFRSRDGEEFFWMPRWAEINLFIKLKDDIDNLNKELLAEHEEGGQENVTEEEHDA